MWDVPIITDRTINRPDIVAHDNWTYQIIEMSVPDDENVTKESEEIDKYRNLGKQNIELDDQYWTNIYKEYREKCLWKKHRKLSV